MLIKRKRGWEMPESAATPESAYHDRRRFLATGVATLSVAAMLPRLAARPAAAAQLAQADDPTAGLYPAPRNMRYRLDRDLTDEKTATTYNNFYEFGSSKNIHQAAQQLKIRPWEVRIDGMVEEPRTVAIDDLLKAMTLEERLYRHRCVEAWAMAVPWTGFPMREFVEWCKPLGAAKYVRMETFKDAAMAPGQKATWYPWPYVEGLTVEEATNELTLLGTGLYGKPMPRQNGAPLRLVVPWKYGFKSLKSIVRFTFTDKRPISFWEEIQASEYGFWANVNPQVAHPRWSQATEEMIGTGGKRVPTTLYNGYGEFVADLYKDKAGEKLFM